MSDTDVIWEAREISQRNSSYYGLRERRQVEAIRMADLALALESELSVLRDQLAAAETAAKALRDLDPPEGWGDRDKAFQWKEAYIARMREAIDAKARAEAAESALAAATTERDFHVAALDSLEEIMFGDLWRRSRDEMEERAVALVAAEARLRSGRESVEPREGMATVYDEHGSYLGCIGVEAWKELVGSGRESHDATLKQLRDALGRAAFVSRHLMEMIDRDTWRASGGDDGQGHYEGDYHAEKTAEEIEGWAALAVPVAPSEDTTD